MFRGKETEHKVAMEDLKCPITMSTCFNPVTTGCGHTFEKEAISKVKSANQPCPLCRAPLKDPFKADNIIQSQIKSLAAKSSELAADIYYSDSILNEVLQDGSASSIELLKAHLINNPATLNKMGDKKEDATTIGNFTVLYILLLCEKGEYFLMDSKVREKISPDSLNYIIPNGEDDDKDSSALYLLTDQQFGLKLLSDDAELRKKINATALNHIRSKGQYKDKSPVFCLSLTDLGRSILLHDPVLRSKIDARALNHVIKEGKFAGQSPASILARTSDGLELLLKTELRTKLSPAYLKELLEMTPRSKQQFHAIERASSFAHAGRSALHTPNLRSKIHTKTLPEVGKSKLKGHYTASVFSKKPAGLELCSKTEFKPSYS